jgi:hypothetical protein
MKCHINSKHEYGTQIFSNIKLAKIFLDDTDDGDVSLINAVANICELPTRFSSYQRDAAVTSLYFISLQDLSTCFGCSVRP